MRTIYIGSGPKSTSKGGSNWKIYMFLFVLLAITGTVLKIAAPTIVEKWINQNGGGAAGYAFSIRDARLSLSRGQVILNDVKVFNPKTNTELLESPELTINLNWSDLVLSQEKKITVSADHVDLILSKDFSSEMVRIKEMGKQKKDFYLNVMEGKIGKLNVIEQKEDKRRNVIALNDLNFKIKEFSLLSINKKTEFSIFSNIAEGGKFNLTGKTTEAHGSTPWSIQGSLKGVPADLLNKIAGDKLPFAFREPRLNAEITAHSDHGKVSGEFTPDIKILNLLEERPGIPTQTIARALTDELTFRLPFTLKDGFTVEYSDIFSKLKNYRKYAGTSERTSEAPVYQTTAKAKKSTFWPF